ncbi:MAG TPA: hypothetical protein PK640_16075, partial [Verrucomicrobiota bacterium]|nr:hypothetical protein [Verrucomicrobiota bacterium]
MESVIGTSSARVCAGAERSPGCDAVAYCPADGAAAALASAAGLAASAGGADWVVVALALTRIDPPALMRMDP